VARALKRGLGRVGHGNDSPLPALGNVDQAAPGALLDGDLPARRKSTSHHRRARISPITKPGIAPKEDHDKAAHVVGFELLATIPGVAARAG